MFFLCVCVCVFFLHGKTQFIVSSEVYHHRPAVNTEVRAGDGQFNGLSG